MAVQSHQEKEDRRHLSQVIDESRSIGEGNKITCPSINQKHSQNAINDNRHLPQRISYQQMMIIIRLSPRR